MPAPHPASRSEQSGPTIPQNNSGTPPDSLPPMPPISAYKAPKSPRRHRRCANSVWVPSIAIQQQPLIPIGRRRPKRRSVIEVMFTGHTDIFGVFARLRAKPRASLVRLDAISVRGSAESHWHGPLDCSRLKISSGGCLNWMLIS